MRAGLLRVMAFHHPFQVRFTRYYSTQRRVPDGVSAASLPVMVSLRWTSLLHRCNFGCIPYRICSKPIIRRNRADGELSAVACCYASRPLMINLAILRHRNATPSSPQGWDLCVPPLLSEGNSVIHRHTDMPSMTQCCDVVFLIANQHDFFRFTTV